MVLPEPHPVAWRRSSRCESNACVEVALEVAHGHGSVAVRDTTLPHLHLTFDDASWRGLVRDIRSGRLGA